jgi:subtilisin family serine protease
MHIRSTALLAVATLGTLALTACADNVSAPVAPASPSAATTTASGSIGIDVLLKGRPTQDQLNQLARFGTISDVLTEINGVALRGRADQISAIRALPFVRWVGPDLERSAGPVDAVAVTDFTDGLDTWNQDAINVTVRPLSSARAVAQTGKGVYVAVVDAGLVNDWRQYFPEERIATQYAVAFGGGPFGPVTVQPGKWEHDVCSHGAAVTSVILGFQFDTLIFQGTAPQSTVIPVKVLNNANRQGSCFAWSSVIARGILYVASLKTGPLAGHPVVINMSIGGGGPNLLERAAIDFAISKGVLVVVSAGNSGAAGMSDPGAYAPVISAAAAGFVGQFANGRRWWFTLDVPDPTNPADFFIADFSSREKAGQDLDVAAPGDWVVGPYQTQLGKISLFFLSGTSFAAPHVSGIVALMLEKNPSLTQAQAEDILEASALPLGAGCRTIIPFLGLPKEEVCWGTDATGAGLAQADKALAATP